MHIRRIRHLVRGPAVDHTQHPQNDTLTLREDVKDAPDRMHACMSRCIGAKLQVHQWPNRDMTQLLRPHHPALPVSHSFCGQQAIVGGPTGKANGQASSRKGHSSSACCYCCPAAHPGCCVQCLFWPAFPGDFRRPPFLIPIIPLRQSGLANLASHPPTQARSFMLSPSLSLPPCGRMRVCVRECVCPTCTLWFEDPPHWTYVSGEGKGLVVRILSSTFHQDLPLCTSKPLHAPEKKADNSA